MVRVPDWEPVLEPDPVRVPVTERVAVFEGLSVTERDRVINPVCVEGAEGVFEGVPVRAGVFGAEGVMVPERVPVVGGVALEVWLMERVTGAEGVTLGVCVKVLEPV